ncbi:MAG: NADH-quinone oxidoreductase subunit L [Frankiaceae bacterium]
MPPAAPVSYLQATGVFSATWLLVLFPLIGAGVLLLGGRYTNKWGPYLGVLTPCASFVFALFLWIAMIGRAGDQREISSTLWTWIPVNGFHVDVGYLIDPLSMSFVLLITGVGGLIHIYSLGYMAHDPRIRLFFGYMNLFVASMLILVLANDYLVLYVGWEGVGLASYLLISFWYFKPEAATAGKKAFVMNRVGDVGLSLAIMTMFWAFGQTNFAAVFGGIGTAGSGVALALTLLLLLGACGKSGQFPLQAWLPDAMTGPTPVSALIHAATMVTAGVYLIARSAAVYNASQDGRTAVLLVGAITLMIGAIIGCAYDDIKKVLAYSTVSQIGYMVLATGLGTAGYALGIAHLLAHGFFKSTLFLSAGSVMEGMEDTTDMRRFGALTKAMTVTHVTFLCGYLAIIGIPPFSGFWTKDAIIEATWDKGGTSGTLLAITAIIGAGFTAFYMTRLMSMTFWSKSRWREDFRPHDAPKVMLIPTSILAVGALCAGGLLVIGRVLQNWLAPAVGEHTEGVRDVNPWLMSTITLVVVLFGVAGGVHGFVRRPVPTTAPVPVSPLVMAARRDLYDNAINEAVFMRPGQWGTRVLVFFDNRGVDGLVNGLAAFIGGTSGVVRKLQTGFVRTYAVGILGGAVIFLGVLLVVRSA